MMVYRESRDGPEKMAATLKMYKINDTLEMSVLHVHVDWSAISGIT